MLKKHRIEEFIRRLKEAHPASCEQDALVLIEFALNRVEDDFTSIPYQPDNWLTDGRMYAPMADSKRRTGNRNISRYRSKGHNTYLGINGAIKIVDIQTRKVLLDKHGFDQRKTGDL